MSPRASPGVRLPVVDDAAEESLDLLSLAHRVGCVVVVDARGGVEIVPDPREQEGGAS